MARWPCGAAAVGPADRGRPGAFRSEIGLQEALVGQRSQVTGVGFLVAAGQLDARRPLRRAADIVLHAQLLPRRRPGLSRVEQRDEDDEHQAPRHREDGAAVDPHHRLRGDLTQSDRVVEGGLGHAPPRSKKEPSYWMMTWSALSLPIFRTATSSTRSTT